MLCALVRAGLARSAGGSGRALVLRDLGALAAPERRPRRDRLVRTSVLGARRGRSLSTLYFGGIGRDLALVAQAALARG